MAKNHTTAKSAAADLKSRANPKKVEVYKRFFKTGPGEYGEGDQFWGVTVPQNREVAKAAQNLALVEIRKLMKSPIHEQRLLALLILSMRVKNDLKTKNQNDHKKVFKFYLQNSRYVNNWDLVDTSADSIVGGYLFHYEKNISLLRKLMRSKDLWQRRIAVLSTFYFIKQNKFDEIFEIAEALLADQEDLMHKATGWMLREAGKRDEVLLKKFLREHIAKMPRTTLRYAIERFSEKDRKMFLNM